MAEIKFELVNINNEGIPLKTTFTLVEMWDYIRMFVNVPQHWNVHEFKDEELIDTINACYLIENYKNQKDVPITIQDIS